MPLSFDFKYEELLEYQGINPKPSDFDAYWAAAIKELDSIDPDVKMLPSSFIPPTFGGKALVECFDLYFTGLGGARIYSKLLKPVSQVKKGPALLLFHGYTMDSGDWNSKLGMAASGLTIAAMDCRGQGGLSEDLGLVRGNTHHGHIIRGLSDALNGHPEKFYYRSVFMDTLRLARIVMAMDSVDEKRVGVSGWSQGGALSVACAALEPRVARAAPVYPFLSDYKRVWEMDQAKQAYEELANWFKRFDPLHEREEEVFTALGYIDIQHLAPLVQANTYWALGLMDTVCPPSSQFAAYNHLQCPKSTAVYPDFAHENLPGHYDRILSFMGGL